MEAKVAAGISLLSVAVGWILAQGAELVKNWVAARRLRNGLLIELKDIQDQLKRVELLHARQLQVYALKGIEPSAAIPVHNMYYKQYFKEAFSHLNREQRISYQTIHAFLDKLNEGNEELADLSSEASKDLKMSQDKSKTLPTIEVWGHHVIALFKLTMIVQWHIDYHLRKPKAPTFDIGGSMHKSYLMFEESLDQKVRDIIERAKQLKREDFDKNYQSSVTQ